MSKTMSCSCTGAVQERCGCETRRALYAPKHPLSRVIEGFYEKCAAFNLRYCPYWRLSATKSSLGNTLKDFLLLFCFFFANFIVFLTIMTRLTMHVSFAVLESAYWIQRSIWNSGKGDTGAMSIGLERTPSP